MRVQRFFALLVLVFAVVPVWNPACAQDAPVEIAELESALESADDGDKPELLNQLATRLWRDNPERTVQLATESLELLEGAERPALEAAAHEIRARAYLWMEESEKCLHDMQAAGELFERVGNVERTAKCYGYQGMALSNLGQLWPAIEAVEKALELFRELENLPGVAAATNNLGVYHEGVGEYETALRYNLESLELERELGREIGIANNLNSIGNIYSRLEEPTKAREYYLEALELFTKIENGFGVAQVLNNVGNTHEDLDEDDDAVDYYQRALAEAKKLPVVEPQIAPHLNMGIVHKKRGEYQKALDSYRRANKLELELGNEAGAATSHQNIGEVLLLMGRYDEAEAELRRSEEICQKYGTNAVLDGTYFNLAELYNRQGKHEKAFEVLRQYGEVRDALLDEEKNRAVTELEQRYQADRRREEIGLLSKDNELLRKDSEIQQLRLSRTRLTVALLGAGIGLLVLTGSLLFRRYRYLLAFWKRKSFIGPFRLQDEIGEGGMGVVYRAVNVTDPSQTVALKVIREELSRDELQRKRFMNEGEIVDSINHPNIVKVLQRGEHNQRLYIAMEYLEGETLSEVIELKAESGSVVPEATSVTMMHQLFDAVSALHARGIVHRDITPANVVVVGVEQERPHVKLLDFGVARLDTMTTLTEAGEILGTVSYLAPERIQHQPPGTASDVFSLGVVFYELLTLEKPFMAEDPVVLLRSILDTEPISPHRYRKKLNSELVELVMSMLAKKPEARPTPDHVKHQLTRLLPAVGST